MAAGARVGVASLNDGRGTSTNVNITAGAVWPAVAVPPAGAISINAPIQNAQWYDMGIQLNAGAGGAAGGGFISDNLNNTALTVRCNPWAAGAPPIDNPNDSAIPAYADLSQSGAPWIHYAPDYTNREGVPTAETSLMEEAKSWASREATITARADVLVEGFLKRDIQAVAGFAHACHVQNDLLIYKLSMYGGFLLLRRTDTSRYSPLEGQSTPIQPWATIHQDQDQARRVVINQSPIVTERCGGDNPSFPWHGRGGNATKGTIRFHTSLSSIPKDVQNLLIVPSNIVNYANSQELLALYIALFAPWPLFNIGMWLNVEDIVGAVPGPGPGVPTSVVEGNGGHSNFTF